MADYIFLKKNGKGADIKVSRQDFAKNPNAYRDYTVRMVDKDGSNWDVPFNHINDAVKDGAHVFNMRDNTPQQKTTTPAPQPKSAVAQQAVNFTQKPAQPYQPTWQERAGMSMAVDQAASMGGSDVQPMVKPGLDTNMLNQNNALANRAMATNLESNQDNIYLDELEKQAIELQKQGQAEVEKQQEGKGFLGNAFDAITGARTGTSQYQSNLQANEKMRQGTAIQKNVDDARKAIKDAEISQNGSWYQKLGRGLANGFDVRNFDLGLTDLQNALTLRSAVNNPNEVNNAVLDSEALKNKIISENEDKISNWITAGETTTMMVPFMVQIASSPFSGLGTAASKWAMSKVGQEIAGSLGKRAALLALKGTTRFLGDAVEGAGAAAFFNTAGITADAMRRQKGNAVGQYGSDGYFHYNEMEGGEDSYAKAFAKAFGASAIEYQSELVGEYFSPLLKGIGKVAGKGLQKAGVLGIKEGFDTTGKKFTNIMLNFGGKNVSLDKTIGMITALSNKQYLKAFNDFTKATRWNGVIGEYAEEVVGNIENAALVGDMNWGTGKDGVFNPEQNWETFLSVAVGSGFMGAIGGGFYMGSRLAVNRGLKKSDKNGMELFGADAWRSIKDGFETADNPARFLASISQNLDEPSKRAIQNYAAYSMAKKGELVADMKQRMEEPQPTNVRITPYKGRFVVQSVDPNGNIIESKDYDSEEDANIYKERVATYIDNARKVQAYNDFILRGDTEKFFGQLGFDFDYDTYSLLKKIAYKDPLKRTDAEQEYFDNFINATENITYPTNEVHEEHDAQKGADLAEETSENIVEGAKPLNDREAAAKTRWNAVVQSQPDIDSLVGSLVNQGMTSNEIAQRLVDDYGGESEVVEAFCELCNAKANKDGYINRIGQLIQSKVENDIDEASFAGTVNGNEDKSNIYLLTNGTNSFALIGGDITVDSNNNISSNGIAIMLDGQGNRMTRPDLTGFSLKGIVDKNQYERSSLLELQQEATAAIQATEIPIQLFNNSDIDTLSPEMPNNNGLTAPEVPQQEQPQEQPQSQVEEQPQEQPATAENTSPIPLDEKGKRLYHKAPIEATINDLYDGALEDEEIRSFVQNNINKSTKDYDKAIKKKPDTGTDKDAYLQAKQAWQQQVDEAKQKLDYWNSVNDYIQQQTHTTPEEIQKTQDELSGKTAQQEYANSKPDMSVTPVQFAGEFIRESKIQTQSFYNETGFGDAERKKFPKMIANDGKTIDSLAEELVSADDTYHNGSLYHGDTTEAKNAILEALQTASKKSELGQNTSDDFKEYERQREEEREAFYEENFNMSYSDYLAFEEQQMPNIWRRMSNFVAEEYDRIVNESYELRDEQNNVEQINNENNGNNTEGNRQLAGGSEVLPTEGSNQQGGTSTSTNPAAETTNGSEGGNQNEEVPGDAQGVEEKKTLNKEEADYLISLMKLNAEIAEEVELSPENWISLFGEDGTINTPIGQVKMGEGQYFKLAQQGRDGKLGMVKPTLENPVVVIEEERPAKNGVSERNTSYIFVKTFKKADGSRLYYFTSVTVSKDGKEVVISNQEKSENRISKLLQQSKIAWINPEFSLHPNTQIEESVPLNDSNSTTSTDNDTALLGVNSSELSEGKDTTKSPNLQENQQKTDEKVEEPQNEEESLPLTEADINADLSETEQDNESPKEKPWDKMDENEKMEYVFSQPLLTEEQIKNAQTNEVNKANALAYIKGQKSMVTRLSYYITYKNVKHSTGSSPANNEAGDTSQLDETNSGGSEGRRTEREHSGLRTQRVDSEGSGQTDSNQSGEQLLRGENGKGRTTDDTGEGGDKQVPGDEQSVGRSDTGSDRSRGSSIDNGNGHNVSQQGGKERSRQNTDANRRGTDKANRDGTTRNAQLNSKNIDSQLQSEIDEFKNLLAEYRNIKNKKNGNINSSIIPGVTINSEKIEAWGKLIYQGAKVGYLILRKGHTSLSEWSRIMKDMLTPAMHDIEVTDAEIDEFIKEMWHCNLPIGDEVHTISEWSKIIQENKLKEAVRLTLEEKKKQQLDAESVEVKIADKNNIAETLPYLLPLQQDDVYKAEMQFFDESHNDYEHAYGKGYMFTNGTGTGKTYTGLGIAKRFIKQGKGRILILTPSSTKVKDWVLDAANLNIKAHNLEEWANAHKTTATTSKAEGVVVTTYANFRQNQALLEDEFDLVIYDESHRLLENKKGSETEGSKQHYMLTNKNEQWAFNRLQTVNQTYKEIQETRKLYDSEYDKEKEKFQDEADAKLNLPTLTEHISKHEGYPNLKAIKEKYDSLVNKYNNEVKPQLEKQAEESVKKTKVVFLSATPFNTKENLGYAEGYIFQYPQSEGRIGRRNQFYLTNFGAAYRWRNNRLESRTTNPEAVAAQEVAFSDYLQNQLGTMSGRVIDSEYDYSRDFPTVTFEKAGELNRAFEEIKKMEGVISRAFYNVMTNYQYTSVLFEAMKTSCILPRIREHINAGRKVVLFHRRMESARPITPPFQEILNNSRILLDEMSGSKEKNEAKAAIADYEQRFAHMLEWEKTLDLRVPRVQILEEFGDDSVLFFSGKETTKQKNAAVEDFNRDSSPKKIIVIQEASGKEGISLHDVTGRNQRVLISLAMPQSPITALQIEGRIYRIGNKSNAIFEYPLLGLDEELITWGQRFNAQVGTTENLALGSKARNLRESFARAVIEHSGDVPLDSQGTGGKEMDEAINQDQTDPFDKSILDFYGNARIRGKRDNREGKDYYPTPEPLGFMMVKWANLSEGESVLEPSAGHGAIARYVPLSNQLTSVEPSTSLFGRLQVLAGGIGRKFENDIFENYNVINKHDVVLMNPPFGTAGRLAIDHVAKAFKHLSEGGRIVAIIPRGSADAKFDKWIQTEKTAALVGEIQLPNITFQNAGTQVACRVVIIDKISNEQMRNEALGNATQIELPNNYDKIEDFFEDLRGITMPARTIDQKTKNDKKIMPIIKEFKDEYGDDFKVEFTPTGVLISGVGLDYLNLKGDMLKMHVAAQYARANKIIQGAPPRLTRLITTYETIKKMALKLADMSEEEMENYISKNVNDNTSDKSLSDQFVYEVKKNTRTGQDMYVVSKNKGVNLTDEEYNKARELAKNNGGYWSRFAGGFIFPSELAAKSFLNGGNTPLADNPQQDNRLAYSSSTNNVNNPRIIPEDVDKDVSLQIESEFDSAIENLNLTEEEKNELENLIGEFSNLGTNDLEYTFYLNNSRLRIRDEKKNNLSEMLWRRGNSVSPSAANVGGNLRDEKSGAESPTTANGEYSAVVSRQSRETERENTSRGNEVQGQYNGPRDIRNTSSDRLLLHEGRRIEEKVVSQTPRTRLSSHQRRLLAAQYAISRELVYRDIRLAAIKESLGLEAGKQTSLDDVAKIFEKYNKNKEVKALFDKILAINKRLGTSVEILESDENGNYGSAGTRRDVRYYLDGFTRTSSNQNVNIPLVIAHELLHQGTVGAINLVRKGKAEGVLTKEQIDAVNTIIDIYNKVKANEGILSESKRGLANPYEFAAQMVDPRQRRALSMSPLQRVMAAANELKAQGNNSLWERIKNALKTLFGLSDLKKMDNAINTLLDTFNETIHDISMADVEQDDWGYTSTQLFDKYPTWLSGQTTGTGQHTTQITSTVNTYKKIGEWMKSQGMNGASVLDASSGLGKGTEALREMGFNVEDVEPYPSETRTPPTYLKYEDIKGKYDVVISNAVLNVIPDDWRADVLKNMADKVKPGGKMIINVRDAKEIEKQKQKIELDSPSEILVTDKAGNIRAYQKGFTQKELADWIQSELGEGWTIETAKPSNSGISGRAVVVTRNTETPLRYRKVSDSMQKPKTSEETKSRMRDAAASLAKSLNTPIKIVTSDEAPEEAKNAKGTYDTQTGEVVIVIDNNQSVLDIEKTVVHEIIGHHGLRGLLGSVRNYRQLMNVIYDSLPEKQKNEIKDKAMRNGYKFYEAMDEYFAEQAENMVWDSSSATMWDNIKHYITEAIRKLGFILRPNYRDVRYWLWLSKNNLQSDNPLSEIKRQAFLHKLSRLDAPKFDNYFNITEGRIDYNDVDTAFRNGDVKSGTTGIILNIKKDDLYTRIKNAVKEAYYDHANSLKVFQKEIEPYIQGGLMDNQNAYLGENQRTSNVADAQEIFQKNEITNLQNVLNVITPLFNGANAKDKLEDLQRYLMKKHGLERNRVLFFRDWFRDNLKKKIEKPEDLPTEAYELYEKRVIGIETDFEDGRIDQEQRDKALQDAVQESWYEYLENVNSGFGKLHNRLADKVDNKTITLADMYRQLDEYINQFTKYDPSEYDYSGLTAFALEKGEELDDAKIIEEVMAIEDSINENNNEILGKLQDAIHAITQKGLDEDLRSGIISKSAYDRASSMFRWYIPLRGFNKDVMEDFFKYDYANDVAIGSVLKKAKGRLTLAFNPLATAINMTANSFSRGEKNLNKQRAYRAVTHYLKGHGTKGAIASVSDVWYKKNNTTGEYEIEVPPIDDKMSAEDMRKTIEEWTETMKSLEREKITKRKTMKGDFIAPFSNIKNKNANIVFLKINGQQKMIIFHGDPRPARVLNGEMAPEKWEYWDDLTRFMSSMATTYNPTFVGANLVRDVLFSNNNIWIKENSKYYRRFLKNQSNIIGSMLSIKNIANLTPLKINVKSNSYVVMYDRYKKGIAPETQEEVYFKEFMENGGRTGITQQFDIDRIEKMIKLATTPKEKMKYLKMPLEKFGLFVEALNERVENANRFCAYMTSRQEGRSVMRSISDAKEVTVNFNRKGASWKTAKYGNTNVEKFAGVTAAIFKHGFMFFNAGIQGFSILWNNLDKHAIDTITSMMLPPFLLGLLLPLLNEYLISVFGGDDDDYANLSPWKRRNYLCIYVGKHHFITIPLPIEQRAFFGLGDIAYSTINNMYSTGKEPFGETMMQIADIFPVDYSKAFTSSESGLVDLMMPDLIKPIWQIHSNRDWTGTMLHKEEAFYNKYDPKYELAFDNENQIAVGIAKLLNKWTSDDKYGLTQGSIDMHPSTLRYLTEQYLGGAGKDALNTMNLAIGLAKLEMNFDCVPFVRGLLQVPNDKNKYTRIKLKYNNYRSESEEYEAKLKKFMKASKSGVKEQADYYKALAEEWKRTKDYRIMVEVNKFIKTKEKRFKKKMDNPALSDTDKKTLQEIFMADKKDLVERIEAIENQY